MVLIYALPGPHRIDNSMECSLAYSLALAGLIASILVPSRLIAQDAPAFQEHLVSVSVTLSVRTLSYTSTSGPDIITVFSGGAQFVSVSVANSTENQVVFDGSDWTEALSLNVRRIDVASGATVGVPEVSGLERAGSTRPTATTLESGKSVTDRFVLVGSDQLSPGNYLITVQLDPQRLDPVARQYLNILRRQVSLRVATAVTEAENLDRLLQLAFAARRDGQPQLVRQYAASALNLNATSILAFSDLAGSYWDQNECAAARPHYQRMLELLDANADPQWRAPASTRKAMGDEVRMRLAKPCP